MPNKLTLNFPSHTQNTKNQAEELAKSAKIFLGRMFKEDFSEIQNISKIESIYRSYSPNFLINFLDNLTYTTSWGWGADFTAARENLRQFYQLDSSHQLEIFFYLVDQNNLDDPSKKLLTQLVHIDGNEADLSRASFHREDRSDLFNFLDKSIQKINLAYSDVLTGDLSTISRRCPDLQELNLMKCSALINLQNLKFPELKELNLASTGINISSVVKTLSTLAPKLETLILSDTYLKDSSFSFKTLAEQAPHLKTLVISSNQELSTKGLNDLTAQDLPQLRVLYLNQRENVSAKDLLFFSSTHPQLTHLSFSATNFKDKDFSQLAHSCKGLEELKLWDCKNIQGDSLKEFALNCPKLKIFSATHLEQVKEEEVINFLNPPKPSQALPLESLSLMGAKHLTDSSLSALEALKNLKHLSLAFCENISNKGIASLKQIKTLEELDLRGLDISIEAINELKRNLPNLKKIILPDDTLLSMETNDPGNTS